VKRGVPARRGSETLLKGDMTVEQLKQLVEIQTQIVEQAEQNKLAQRKGWTSRFHLIGGPRRLLRYISQLW